MSLLALQDDSSLSHRDYPSGESFTRHSSHLRLATLISAVLVTAGIALFIYFAHTPPVSVGTVSGVWAHGVHTLSSSVDAAGVPVASEPYDQVLVFAKVRLHNQSNQPVVLREMMTNVTMEDGLRSSYVATETDYKRIFIAYPELAGLHAPPITRDTVIEPGESLEGMIVSSFRCTKEMWATHKDLSFTFQFKLHPDLVIVPTSPIVEQ